MAGLQAQRVKPAFEGMNTEAAPDYLSDAQAPLVENLLCRPGKLVMRGPIHHTSAPWGLGSGSGPSGVLAVGATVLVGASPAGVASAVAVATDPDGVDSVTAVVVTAATQPGSHRFAAYGGNGYSKGSTGLFIRWPGTASAPTSYAAAVAPSGFVDIAAFADRVFVLGGTFNGTFNPRALRWSVAGGPAAGTLADWQGPVSGLDNMIEINDADGVAIHTLRRELLVFTRTTVWSMTGSGASSFSLRRVAGNLGCVNVDSITTIDDAVYFMSDVGYMRYDGASITNISRSIGPTISRGVQAALYGVATVRVAALREGYLLLVIYGYGALLFQGLYDTQRGVWSKFTTSATSPISVLVRAPNYNHTLATDGVSMFCVSDLGATDVRDPAGAVRNLRDVVNGTTTAITAKWHSRLIKLASPVSASQLKRILLDYRMDIGAGVAGWFVSLWRGDGTAAVAEYQVPGEAAGAPTYLSRRRSEVDAYGEVVDVQLRVEWRDAGTTAFTKAEIYDATIEYQGTRDRADS